MGRWHCVFVIKSEAKWGILHVVSKNELILGQFSHLFKWTLVYSILSTLECINMVFTHKPQKTQGKVAVGRRGLISSVAQKLWFAWLLSWWNPVSPSQGVHSFPWPPISCSVGCFTCSSTEDVSTDSRQITLESVGSEDLFVPGRVWNLPLWSPDSEALIGQAQLIC